MMVLFTLMSRNSSCIVTLGWTLIDIESCCGFSGCRSVAFGMWSLQPAAPGVGRSLSVKSNDLYIWNVLGNLLVCLFSIYIDILKYECFN